MTALLIAFALALIAFVARRSALRLQQRPLPVRIATRPRR